MKRFKFSLIALAIMLSMTSIPTHAASFGLNTSKVTMNIGDTYDLDALGTTIEPRWTSWNINNARVDNEGVVTAVRKGKATVSARIGLTFKKCNVTIVDPTIKLAKTSATIYTGGTSTSTVQLKATAKGASKNITWCSLNPEVAIVNETGKVTSVAPGEAIITATANGKTVECKVTVKDSSITLNHDAILLSTKGNGSSIKLVPTVVGSSKSVKWTSSDKKIATVSNGKVTGKSDGTATITATSNGLSASCEVTVQNGLISINEEKVALYTNESLQLKTNATTNDVLEWRSSDENVVTVENGKLTAIAPGTAIVSVVSNATEDTCVVTVEDTSIDITNDSVVLRTKGADKTLTLQCIVIGRNKNVTWVSSDKKIASVNKGKVTALKPGNVTITATANGLWDTVDIEVKEFEPTIKLNQSEYTLYTNKGNTLALKATVDGASKKAEWSSSDESVATVKNGKVTALKAGQALITATANGVTADCAITVEESRVILPRENIFMEVGNKEHLPADVVGIKQNVTYKSSDSKVVSVSKGVLTAKDFGKAYITVTANGVSSVCHVVVDRCVHVFDEGRVYKAPTCSEEGSRILTCTKCKDFCYETIEKLDHAWNETNKQDATCLNSGLIDYGCTICGESKQEILEPVDHKYSSWVTIKAPTATEDGYKNRFCVWCSDVQTEVIPSSHEHVYDDTSKVVTAPDCTNYGYTVYTCECGHTYKTDYTDRLGHDFEEDYTVDTEPTCTSSGSKSQHCSRCDAKNNALILPELGHTFSDWVVTKEPSATEDGERTRTCSRCLTTEKQVVSNEHTHSYTEEVTAPTCTEVGYTLYTCTCGDSYKGDYKSALDHNLGEWEITVQPTELTVGEQVKACSRCDYVLKQVLAKLPHTHSFTPTVYEPDCTAPGYTLYTCACGITYKGDYVSALDHNYGDWVTNVQPTETTTGKESKTCSRCSNVVEREIPALNHVHVYTSDVTDPTCTRAGYTEYTCSCGDVYKDNSTDALGHNFGDWTVTETATETEDGESSRTCNRCSTVEVKTIPKLEHEHNYTPTTVDPTCTEIGYKEFVCTCGHSYKGEYKSLLGHIWSDWTTTKAATTTEDGVMTRTCSRCSSSDTKVIPMLGESHTHAFEHTVTAPTCTEAGFTTYLCNCGDSYKSDYTDATGHDFSTWSTTTEATELATGVQTRTCNNCSKVETQDIPKLEHRHNYTGTDTDATCVSAGYTTYNCVCGESYVSNYVDATGHDFSDWVTGTEPTETEVGKQSRTCSNCSTTETQDLPKKNHEHSYIPTVTDAGCTTEGYTTYNCPCGATYKSAYTDALNHNWSNWVTTVQPTVSEVGTETRTCDRCQSTQTQDIPKLAHTHTFNDDVTAPTCVNSGYTTHVCECGESYKDTYTDALGHTWSEWTVTKDATITEVGSRFRTCSVCNGTETQEIPKVEHDHSYESTTVNPTCTEAGYVLFECACGHTYTDDIPVTSLEPGLYDDQGNPIVSWDVLSDMGVDVTGYFAADDFEYNSKHLTYVINDSYPETYKVVLPEGIDTIGEEALSHCPAKEIVIPEGVTNIAYAFTDSAVETLVTPSSLTEIGTYAFINCKSLHTLVLTNVESIGNYALSGCTELCNLILAGDLYEISEGAFYDCYSLENVYYTGSNEDLSNVSIHDYNDCLLDAGITCDYVYTPPATLNPNAALGHDWTDWIIVDATEDSEGSKTRTCNRCSTVETVVIPKIEIVDFTVTADNRAQVGYTGSSNEELVIPETFTGTDGVQYKVVAIGEDAFKNCYNLKSVTLPSSVTTLGDYAFYDCYALQTATIESNLKNVGYRVFSGNDSLESVYITGNAEVIGVDMFGFCYELVNLELSDTIKVIEDNAFGACTGLTEIDLPDNLESIGAGAFAMCSSLKEVELPDSIVNIETSAFANNECLVSISIPDTNANYCSVDGVLFSKDMKTLVQYPSGKTDTSYVVPDGITTINSTAMGSCINLVNITLPESLTSVAEYAFTRCESLKEITIPESVTTLESYVFDSCTDLKTITLSNSMQTIKSNAFYNCNSLKTVYFYGSQQDWKNIDIDEYGNNYLLNAKIIYIDLSQPFPEFTVTNNNRAQVGYTSASGLELVIPEYFIGNDSKIYKVTAISNWAFSNCSNIKSVVIPKSVESIGERAFYGNTALESVKIEGALTTVGGYAFDSCSALKSIELAEGTTTIGEHMFSSSAITEITLPSTIQSVNDYAFYKCSSLSSINIPANVESIGKAAFHSCSSLSAVTIPEGMKSIGERAFSYCHALESITIPSSVTTIGTYAFADNNLLKNVTLSPNTTVLDEGVFARCKALESIVIPEGVETVGYSSFDGCDVLTNVQLPSTLKTIAKYAFYNCAFQSITLPEGLVEIGNNAFIDCKYLNSLYIPASVTTLGETITLRCVSLDNIEVAPENANYCSVDGLLFSKDMSTLIRYPSAKEGSSYTVPDSVTELGKNVFAECNNLTDIILSNNINTIIDSTFYNANNLTTLTLNNSVTSIASFAFYKCNNLQTINFKGTPEEWASISVNSSGNSALEQANIVYVGYVPNYFKTNNIGTVTGVIDEAKTMTELVLPSSIDEEAIVSIGQFAFYGCNSLQNMTLPDTVTYIGPNSFYNCSNLKTITFSSNVKTIADCAFLGCSNLETVYFNGTQEQWQAITVGTSNDAITSANIVFNQ